MRLSASLRRLLLIRLDWAIVMLAFRHWILLRFDVGREWTIHETAARSQDDKLYLRDPFLNVHVA